MAYRSSTQASGTAGAAVSPAKPTGLATGDVLTAWVVGKYASMTAPSGFTQVGADVALKDAAGSSVGIARCYEKPITSGGTEPSSYTFTPNAGDLIVILVATSGRNTTTPVTANSGSAAGLPALVISAPSITGATHDDLLCFSASVDGSRTWTPPSGMTEDQDVQVSGSLTASVAHLADLAGGATGAQKFAESTQTATLLDDFNRTTGLGSNWSLLGGAARLPVEWGNQWLTSDSAGASGAYWSAAAAPAADHAIRIQLTGFPSANANGIKIFGRMTTPAASPRGGYSLRINTNTTTGIHDWVIFKESVASGQPTLASASQLVTLGDDVEFRLTGNVLQGWLIPASGDPVCVLTATDSTYSAAGNHGLFMNVSMVIDNYRVTAVNSISQPVAFAVALAVAGAGSQPANTVLPAITGTTKVGSVLTCSTGTWTNTPTSYTYQWQRDDGTSNYTNIPGATANTYTLQNADDLLHVRCIVTAVNASGSGTATAAAVGPIGVTAPAIDSIPIGPITTTAIVPSNLSAPTIIGAGTKGTMLQGNDGVWSGDQSRTRQWQSDKTGSWVDIPGATNQNYTVQDSDVGYDLRFTVTAINQTGSTTATSTMLGPIIEAGAVVDAATAEEQDFGTTFADAAYAELAPVTKQDAQLGYPLRNYIRSLGIMFQRIDYLGHTDDSKDAWAGLIDLVHTPDDALPWLGQFVGVEVDTGKSVAQQRNQIQNVSGWARGSALAMRNAITPFLTGNQQVIFAERDSDPYTLSVITRSSETPDQASVLAALLALKPAGIRLNYLVSTGNTYLEVRTTYATYTALRSAFATYAALRGY